MQNQPYLLEVKILWEKVADDTRYPFCIPAISNIERILFDTPVTYIIGENGSGKSTLIEAIAVALGLNAEGGNKNTNFSTSNHQSDLHDYLGTAKSAIIPRDWYFLRAESFYNMASYMDEIGYLEGYGGKSLHQLSHGESFMSVLSNKLKGRGFYLFDEPEAALSPTRQLQALAEFHRLVQSGSQLIITTHSPILMAYPGATIYQLSESGIEEIEYTDTEHYCITKNFLNRPDMMLKTLLAD